MRQSWQDVLDVFASSLGISPVNVPFDQWLRNVQAVVHEHGTEEERMEYDMLADFLQNDFQRMATGSIILDTSRTRTVSRTLREVGEISQEVVAKYVGEWRRNGTLRTP